MLSSYSWPLDSPISFGLSLCLFGFFLLGFVVSINPRYITGRESNSDHAFDMDRRLGRVFMGIFGIACIVVLSISWVRSNNTRYAWLDE